jgi:hypothetical protein
LVASVNVAAAAEPAGPEGVEAARPGTGLPPRIALGAAIVSALAFYALLTHGTFSPTYEQDQLGFAGQFYLAQAQAIVHHGRLWVNPTQIPSECWVHAGRCYGYFGLTPSLIRTPFLGLLDNGNHSCPALFMAIALTLTVIAALWIVGQVLAIVSRRGLGLMLSAGVALSVGPASVLAAVARPAVYEEAIAWSVAFAMIAIVAYMRWWTTGSRWGAALALVSIVLSANARPTTVALGALLGLGVLVRSLLATPRRLRPGPLTFALAVGVLPFLTCIGVYYLKFHTTIPNSLLNQQIGGPAAAPWWLAIRKVDHNQLQGLRFLPSALVAFLRPDGVALSHAFPFFTFRFGPLRGVKPIAISPGAYYIEPFTTVPDQMPFAALAIIAGLVYGIVRFVRAGPLRPLLATALGSPLTYCLVGAIGSVVVMLTQGVITNRYLADFYPAVAVGLALAARLLWPALAGLPRRGRIAVGLGIAVTVLWAIVANLGIEYQFWWHTVASQSR